MIPATRSSTGDSDTLIVSLDAGTSSVRTLLYDSNAKQCPGFGAHLPYEITTTAEGGFEVDANELVRISSECLSILHSQMDKAGLRPAAVAFCAFWHSFLGVDVDGKPTMPILHVFDTRSAAAAQELAQHVDPAAIHRRTGCVLHPSYWPAKLVWLSQARSAEFTATRAWLSFGEYLFLKLFGNPVTSTSMLSGSGLWDQNLNRYDEEMLDVLPIDRSQLATAQQTDAPQSKLLPEYKRRWPLFDGIPWFPALGDGACDNIGSGCVTPDRFALMVGTSGAMRAVVEAPRIEIPPGLWCYRVDPERFVVGGSLSNGGDVFAWLKSTLILPEPEELEAQLAQMEPGSHNLTVLPLFAGERSPKWRSGARAAITGLALHTNPVEMVRASLESVAITFRQIYDILNAQLGHASEIVASGGALLHSPAWTQMMADALGRPVVMCLEQEASSRGAALLALERLGVISHVKELPAETGRTFLPSDAHYTIYNRLLASQECLYLKLLEEI